jgi:adenylate kinase
MFNVILFGPPGSGKGTQSEKLIEKYGLRHLSTGELLRKEMEDCTSLGLEAKSFMDKGDLVPDEVVIGIIRCILDNNPDANGFLFDGFPRTVAQAKALNRLLEEKNTSIDIVLFLHVNEEELIKRLVKRGETSGRSDDADPRIQRERQQTYKDKTLPVADYYAAQGKVVDIQGEGTVEETFDLLAEAIDKRCVETPEGNE